MYPTTIAQLEFVLFFYFMNGAARGLLTIFISHDQTFWYHECTVRSFTVSSRNALLIYFAAFAALWSI